MSSNNIRYVHNKDCSEYVEEFVASNGGSLASIMFIDGNDLGSHLITFEHPLYIGNVRQLESYVYHTIAVDRFMTIDVTNGMRRMPLDHLIVDIRRNNPHLNRPGIVGVAIPNYIPSINVIAKDVSILQTIYRG